MPTVAGAWRWTFSSLLSASSEDAASSGSATGVWGHRSHEHRLLCQTWERSECLETQSNHTSCSAHNNLIFPLPDTPGEPRAPQTLQRGAGCALRGASLLTILSSALAPRVSSHAQLCLTSPPGNSAGKRQETDVVLICAQLISTMTSTPSAAPQRVHMLMQERGAGWLPPAPVQGCAGSCAVPAAVHTSGHPCTPWPSGRSISWVSQHFLQAHFCGWGS